MQDKAVWLVAAAAIAVLAAAGTWQRAQSRAVEEQSLPRPARAVSPAVSTFQPVRVEILNGCGAPQVAARLTRRARKLGLDVIDEGNARSFGFRQSMVIDRRGDMNKARRVADLLGIPICIQQITRDPAVLAELSIVIGRDHEELGLLSP